MTLKTIGRFCLIALLAFFIGCKGNSEKPNKTTKDNDLNSEKVDSSQDKQYQKPGKKKTGVGPIDHEVKLEKQIDEAMATKGEKLFNNECTTCHRVHESAVGPALGGVLDERSPQWVMNMILNPRGMIENNVQVKAMVSDYETKMVDLDLSEREARQIVEYLRKY